MPARISLRVSPYQWASPSRLDELLSELGARRGLIDEVALFSHATHPAMPLALVHERARGMAVALPRFRDLGLGAGINVTSIIGHLDEFLGGSLSEPWQHLVGPDGEASASCYCWTDPRVLAYVRELMQAMAAARPDFIWVDDDIRLVGHRAAVPYACFCDACLEVYGRETGKTWTRRSLLESFDTGRREERLASRRSWLSHNRAFVSRILSVCRAAVDEVAPGLPLGFMTIDASWAGHGYAGWADALRSPHAPDVSPKWRPGGGFYNDETPRALLTKAHATGRQVSYLPADVTDIQYEHENGPYFPFDKSRRVFLAEMPAALGVGCTGVALNISLFIDNPLEEHLPYLDATAGIRPFLDACVDTLGPLPRTGIWRAGTPDVLAASNIEGSWLGPAMGGYDAGALLTLGEVGLPVAYRAEGAVLTLLPGDTCLQYTAVELERILGGGFLTDGPGLSRLTEMGLGRHLGFRRAERWDTDVLEVYTEDPMNGRFAGWKRDCRPAFWNEITWRIEPTQASARVLTELRHLDGNDLGPVSGCWENSLGGRGAVMGYVPWTMLGSLARTSQLKTLARWLSRDRLPAWVASFHKIALWCAGGAVLALNTSLDEARDVVLAVSGAAAAGFRSQAGASGALDAVGADGSYGLFRVGEMGPWEAVLVTGGDA